MCVYTSWTAEKGGGVRTVEGTIDLLQDVFQYELACAERYRRFVSLVMATERSNGEKLAHVLTDKVRDSDLLVENDSTFLILMSETDRSGAETAISRIVDRDGDVHDFRFSLVTYPNDSGSAKLLMDAAERRLLKASEGERGTIVSAD